MELINKPGVMEMNFLGQDIIIGDMWYMTTPQYADSSQGYYSATGEAFVDALTLDLKWGYPDPRNFYSILQNGKPFDIIKWFQKKYPDGLPTSNTIAYFNEDGETVPTTQAEKNLVGLTLYMYFTGGRCYFMGFFGYRDPWPYADYPYNRRVLEQNEVLHYYGADVTNITDADHEAATLWFYKPQISYLPDGTNGVYSHVVSPGPVDNLVYFFQNGELQNFAGENANLFEARLGRPLSAQFPYNGPQNTVFQVPSIVDYDDYDGWGHPFSVGSASDYKALYIPFRGGSKTSWFPTTNLPEGEVIIPPDDFEYYDNDPDPDLDPDEPDTTGGHGDYEESEGSVPPDEMIIPPSIISNSGCAHLYLPTSAQTQNFYKELWDQDLLDYLKNMFTNNPMDCVISLAAYPMDFDALGYRSSNTVKCVVGDREMETEMFYTNNDFVGVDFGRIYLSERWGSAIDYEPYTRMQLFLPFIGFVDISPNDVYVSEQRIREAKKKAITIPSQKGYIHLRYMINLFTGDCVAYVFGYGNALKETLIGTYTGVCGMQVPITGRDYNSYFSSVAGGILKSVGSALSGSIGAAAGDLVTTAISCSGGPPVQRSGSFTSGTSLIGQLRPYLIRTTPQQDLPNFDGYRKVAGLPYNKYISLANVTGYIEIEEVKASGFSGTDEELSEFLTLAKGGIWFEAEGH